MNLFQIYKLIKLVEMVIFVLFIGVLALTLFSEIACNSLSPQGFCTVVGVGRPFSILGLLFTLPSFAVISSLHLWAVHEIKIGHHENDFYKVGLIGLATCYITYTFYRAASVFLLATTANLIKSVIYLMIGTTAVVFFNNADVWHRTNLFVKLRILSCLGHLIAMTMDPFLGVIVGLILLPITMFVNDGCHDLRRPVTSSVKIA